MKKLSLAKLEKEFPKNKNFEQFCMELCKFTAQYGGEILPFIEPDRKIFGFICAFSVDGNEIIRSPTFQKTQFKNTKIYSIFDKGEKSMELAQACQHGRHNLLERIFGIVNE